MNNDEWTTFEEKLSPEARQAVERARSHYFDDALKSYLVAFLKMLEGHEEHLEGLRGQTARYLGNQELITEHLGRQDAKFDQVVEKVENVSAGQSALTDRFSAAIERLDDWRHDVDTWRAGVEEWRVGVDTDITSFKESRKQSQRQHEETKEHRQALDRQVGEILELVYKMGVDIAALKEQGSGNG